MQCDLPQKFMIVAWLYPVLQPQLLGWGSRYPAAAHSLHHTEYSAHTSAGLVPAELLNEQISCEVSDFKRIGQWAVSPSRKTSMCLSTITSEERRVDQALGA